MTFSKNIRIIIAAAISVAAAVSCKKDNTDAEVLPSLSGQLRFEMESYAFENESITVTPSGVSHPEGRGFGYYWTVSSVTEQNDTTKTESDPVTATGEYTFTTPDSLGTFTVSCTAFASGYYSTSSSRYVTTVNVRESVIDTTLGYAGSFSYFTDPRDNKIYRTVKVGNTEWFSENLAYAGTADAPTGLPYDNASAMTDIFGLYYTWSEAVSACPDGWRLPDADDWMALANTYVKSGDDMFTDPYGDFAGVTGALMVDAKFNSEDNPMWEYWPDVKITNESGLAVLPCGFANITVTPDGKAGYFDTAYRYAAFWTGDENPDENDQAYIRYIYWDAPVMQLSSTPKESFATTVRCIK